MAALVLVTAGLLFGLPAHTQAVMYHCVDENGARAFTDSPTDARRCVVADGSTSPATPEQDVRSGRDAGRTDFTGGEPRHLDKAEEARPSTGGGGYVAIPLQTVGRSLAITVRLNGERQARLIVDTGATLTLLSRAIARDLGLFADSPISSAVVSTAGGQVPVDVVKIAAIEAGGATVYNVPVAIYDLPDAPPSIEGLLGLSFLSHFLVTLDMQRSELRLTSR